MSDVKNVSITVLLPSGMLPLDLMAAAHRIAEKYSLRIYLSNAQNLRLIDVPEDVADTIKTELKALGCELKGPGKFPIPKVCIGQGHCNLGLIDTGKLSNKILEKFSSRPHTKAKFKIAVAACPLSCSDTKTSDIGIVATREGFEVYAGGKGGPFPKVGHRIERNCDEERVLEIITELVEFHHQKTEKKQRMNKLLGDTEFPFSEV
ncbi:NAD(P)/FAD-dependent oxidoreductase [Desulfopila aestuarii]|uniref:Nitrite/Sulfite reductase ferredoxin-like half domain-containing protein n=1 Tax=Desulfopila aestuarii DSM 18488 TaxID=1121416 RepID=A0A1M7YJI5_9BACT|nr:nitrite reductase [Desulfopila aestuarii]SHO52775.1 Nitrite/Sulfite reductase ferredoxin-like half domain-containing protein [Desulfopila aestuarii DSM 18488]